MNEFLQRAMRWGGVWPAGAWWVAISLAIFSSILNAAPTTTTLVPAFGWDIKTEGGFPVSLAADAAGNVWAGTEGNGLWRYDAAKKSWTRFTTKEGLGDDCVYALAFDRQNRLWAGHLNHGVSVYNGVQWKNYALVDGPLGDRVFAIAVSPKDGDVWIATDMGLARYSEQRQDWDYYTRASGLPSDQIQCLAFDDQAQLFAGTQCSGIAIAGPADNYTKWRTVTAPASIPAAGDGEGLISNLINGVHTLPPDGKNPLVAALTPFGLSLTSTGESWLFTRGKDWRDHTPGPYEPSADSEGQPAEDWMTALAHAGTRVYTGYRKSGIDSADLPAPDSSLVEANVAKSATVFIRAILVLPGQFPLVAAYDGTAGGLLTFANAPSYNPATSGTTATLLTPLPTPAPLPTLDDAKALGARLGKLTEQLAAGEAYFLADDWRTEGDWIGRYGSGYVKLCGMAQGDQDYTLQPGYRVHLQLGPHHEPAATGPIWHHDTETSDDLRSLYDPTLGHRRDAEDNDGSFDTKTYPESYPGPDLWVRLTVPEGVQCLSLYFVNDDAHTGGSNKYRDYDVQILQGAGNDAQVQSEAPLAETRVTDFWGGVYKQFLVCGPADYVVRIGRNRSFVTKLQAVFLDRVTGLEPETSGQLPGFDTVPYAPPETPDDYHPTPLADAAGNLWGQLDDALGLRGAIPLQMPLRIWCYRAAIAGQAPAALLEHWRWQIGIWTPDDRKKFDAAVKAAADAAK